MTLRVCLFLMTGLLGFYSSAQEMTLKDLRGHSMLTVEKDLAAACRQMPLAAGASQVLKDLQMKINSVQCERSSQLNEEFNYLFSEFFARDLILKNGRSQLASSLMKEAMKSGGRIQWLMFSDIRRLIDSALKNTDLSIEDRNQIHELRRRAETAQAEAKQVEFLLDQKAAHFRSTGISLSSDSAAPMNSSVSKGAN